MVENKRKLREEYKRLRKLLSSPEKDEAIANNLFCSQLMKKSDFFVYLSFGTEVNTKNIVETLIKSGKTVCAPRVVKNEMFAAPLGRAEKHQLGFYQPTEGEDTPCEVALCPLLAYDGEGYRLGYGGGFYDRYFISHPNVLRVGLAYEGQACLSLPREKGDIPLQAMITERGIRAFCKEFERFL